MMQNKKFLRNVEKTAIKAALEGGKILKKYFQKKLTVHEKPGAGLVTNADFEAQEKIVKILKRAFPDFGFLTEEASPEKSRNGCRWVIDPLDGTTNFVHGFPIFCVSIGAEYNGKMIFGVIHHPIFQETYWATLGQGAFLNKKKIQISKTQELKNSLLTTGFSYQNNHSSFQQEVQTFKNLNQLARAVRRPGSAALDLAYTARGVFDGFWEKDLSPWDVAAGSLIVSEAGGRVTDFQGNEFKIDSGQILATNSLLHSSLIEKIKDQVNNR